MYIYAEKLNYTVKMLTANGTLYDLTPCVTSLLWEEFENSLAQKSALQLRNIKVEGQWLMELVALGSQIFISADCGGMVHSCFVGSVWDWSYASATQKELHLTCYDKLKYLQQSQDSAYYSAGLTTEGLLSQICQTWEIPLCYWWSESVTHEKQVFQNQYISEMIFQVLEEVKKQTSVPYVCFWADDMLVVKNFGTDAEIFTVDEKSAFSTSHKFSLGDLVTRVKILGTADDEGRHSVEAVVDGDQSFGILQKIEVRDSAKTLAEAQAEAETILEEYNKPEETISVSCLDIPFLRKGYHLKLSAGDLVGTFRVLGVCHRADDKKMDVQLERILEE